MVIIIQGSVRLVVFILGEEVVGTIVWVVRGLAATLFLRVN